MRETIYQALVADEVLNDVYGLNGDTIFPNFSVDNPPRSMFAVIRWQEQNVKSRSIGRGPVMMSVWVHVPREVSTDFVSIDNAIDEIKQCVLACNGELAWGHKITDIHFNGVSGDLSDISLNTITKNISFEILSHRVG